MNDGQPVLISISHGRYVVPDDLNRKVKFFILEFEEPVSLNKVLDNISGPLTEVYHDVPPLSVKAFEHLRLHDRE